jgi:hypothetical protein
MNEQQFMEAIEQHPELTASGFGVTHWDDLVKEREALSHSFDAFNKSYEFLKSKTQEELRNMLMRDSYSLKHVVERAVGTYVPEGAFDLAALVFGCTIAETIEDSPSVFFQLPSVNETINIG